MNKKTIAIFAVSMVLVAALSVFTTLALLTSTTTTVTNVFTSGNVKITLDEAMMNADGTDFVYEEDNITPKRTSTSTDVINKYKLYPSVPVTKDPTINVEAGSEDCYVGATVYVDITGVDMSKFPTENGNGVIINDDILSTIFGVSTFGANWTQSGVVTPKYDTVDTTKVVGYTYVLYNTVMYSSTSNTTFAPIFEQITVNAAVTGDQLTEIQKIKIVVNGYAAQAAGSGDAITALHAGFSDVF